MKTFRPQLHPFSINSGSMRVADVYTLIILLSGISIMTLFILKAELLGIILCLSLFVLSALLYAVFTSPKLGIYILIILGFFAIGTSRYIDAPWGLSIDVMLVVIYVALFFKAFAKKIPWHKAKSSLTIVVSIWFVYVLLQLANPEVLSIKAWFYAMRGVGLYQFLAIPLVFLLYNKQKDLNHFFIIWGIHIYE